MEQALAKHVKINLGKIHVPLDATEINATAHPFFFSADKDNTYVLYVTGKPGKFSVVGSLEAANKRMRRVRPSYPGVPEGTPFCAGVVGRHGDRYYFHVLLRKKLSDAALKAGLTALKKQVGLVKFRLGLPGDPPEAQETVLSPEQVGWFQSFAAQPEEPTPEQIATLIEQWRLIARRTPTAHLPALIAQILAVGGNNSDFMVAFLLKESLIHDRSPDLSEETEAQLEQQWAERFDRLLPAMDDLGAYSQAWEGLMARLSLAERWRTAMHIDDHIRTFMEGQVEARKYVSDSDTVRGAKSRERQRLLKLKEESLGRQLVRAKHLADWLNQNPHEPELARELEAIFEEIRRGMEVVKQEREARKRASKKMMDALVQQYPFYYRNNEKMAAVPIETINRNLSLLEELTLYQDPARLLADLQESLGGRIHVIRHPDENLIRIGTGLVVDVADLQEHTPHVLILLKNLADTRAGRDLLRTLAHSPREVTIAFAGEDESSPFFNRADPDRHDQKRRKERRKEKKDRRHRAQTEKRRIEDLQKDPRLQELHRLQQEVHKAIADASELDSHQVKQQMDAVEPGSWATENALRQAQVQAAQEAVAALKEQSPEVARLQEDLDDAEARLSLLNEHWESSLRKRGSTVQMRFGETGLEIRKKFHHAGMSAPLPEDLILFHELTHALHDIQGESRAHLSSERWKNEEEHWTVLAETVYAEEAGLRWKRVQYDAALSPIDTPMPDTLPPGKLEQLRQKFRKKNQRDDV